VTRVSNHDGPRARELRYRSAPARRDEILRRLHTVGHASPAELGAALSVSERTVRRDLQRLVESGQVELVHGGAMPKPGARPGSSFRVRSRIQPEQKHRIAVTAAALVDPGTTIGLDAGTTTAELAHLLPAGVSVVTNSLPAMIVLQDRADITLTGLGGTYDPLTQSFQGPGTVTALRGARLDTFFLAASGLAPDGAHCNAERDAETKRAFLDIADRVVLLADCSKLRESAPAHICGYTRIGSFVTDELPGPERNWFTEAGTQVHLAERGNSGTTEAD
jgi:DeoR/GlpR family transcriptional regulator of sugar metabolism